MIFMYRYYLVKNIKLYFTKTQTPFEYESNCIIFMIYKYFVDQIYSQTFFLVGVSL
jgi:hypothetical protein